MNYHWQSMKLCLKTKMRILALSVIDDCSLNILQLVFNGNDNNKIVSNNRLFHSSPSSLAVARNGSIQITQPPQIITYLLIHEICVCMDERYVLPFNSLVIT